MAEACGFEWGIDSPAVRIRSFQEQCAQFPTVAGLRGGRGRVGLHQADIMGGEPCGLQLVQQGGR